MILMLDPELCDDAIFTQHSKAGNLHQHVSVF